MTCSASPTWRLRTGPPCWSPTPKMRSTCNQEWSLWVESAVPLTSGVSVCVLLNLQVFKHWLMKHYRLPSKSCPLVSFSCLHVLCVLSRFDCTLIVPCLGFCRVLAFSESPITAVYVSVDGVTLGKAASAGGPLYVLLWDPMHYATGLHNIKVKVEVANDLNNHPTLNMLG